MRIFLSALLLHWTIVVLAQQVADTSYQPPIPNPVYPEQNGPIIFIDEGHYNFHTKEGRYKAFSNLLERDGYQVNAYQGNFTPKDLEKGKILVISNALSKRNSKVWELPTPSAFSKKEIEIIKDWVNTGGSLFLIADHMPLGGCAEDLAAAFGFEFTNGFVVDTTKEGNAVGKAVFTRENGLLFENKITNGRSSHEKVSKVVSFMGQAFKIPDGAEPLTVFDENWINLLPQKAWVFDETTPRQPADGWYQGAYMKYGKGRIVMSGEAAMFSAQLAGPDQLPMGMNVPDAEQNYQFLLNIIHWLDGQLE